MTGIICECCGKGVLKTGAICDPCIAAFHHQQEEIERLRLAYDALRHATLAAHSSHFDRTGGSGTGCLACIDIRAARKNADEVAGYPWLEEK